MKNPPLTIESVSRHNGKTRILVFALEVQYLQIDGIFEEVYAYEFNSELTEKRNKMSYSQFIATCS